MTRTSHRRARTGRSTDEAAGGDDVAEGGWIAFALADPAEWASEIVTRIDGVVAVRATGRHLEVGVDAAATKVTVVTELLEAGATIRDLGVPPAERFPDRPRRS